MKEFKVWKIYTQNAFQIILNGKGIAALFFMAKTLRILLFLLFLHFLFGDMRELAGYSRDQIIFFYLTFNLIDSVGQMLFREVYRFLNMIVTGGLDLVLVKPINPLVRALLGGFDFLDFFELMVIIPATFWFALNNISMDPRNWLLFFMLLLNGFIISAAFHIFVLGIGVRTTKIDHMILIYRDLSSMMRIPIDLYIDPLKFILTFIIPLGIMITFPAKGLIGILDFFSILVALGLGISIFLASLMFWKGSLKHYQSAGG
jgi:ABC-2 type transport system permease protein